MVKCYNVLNFRYFSILEFTLKKNKRKEKKRKSKIKSLTEIQTVKITE